MKVYKSFSEIDRDLNILKLQSEIEKEQMKLTFSEIKEDFSPISIAGNFIGAIAKKAIMFKTIAGILRLGRK